LLPWHDDDAAKVALRCKQSSMMLTMVSDGAASRSWDAPVRMS
jgi:hypothetical protein